MRESDEPTWVYHKRWGWLPDECPLFEAQFTGGTNELRVAVDVGRHIELVNAERHIGWVCGRVRTSGGGLQYEPLTTAARDLLAALQAEAGAPHGRGP